MSNLDVRIVKLEPMLVASFLGFGESPEDLAWKQLIPWAKSKGLLDDAETHRIFGFNNPDPPPAALTTAMRRGLRLIPILRWKMK